MADSFQWWHKLHFITIYYGEKKIIIFIKLARAIVHTEGTEK